MLWKLQFNSESVSERIDHFRRPSSYVFSTKSDEIKFFRYLHEQSYFLKKKSSQSHQPSWRVMLWKLQFNSESVSERISHFWRPSSHVFSTKSDEIKFFDISMTKAIFCKKTHHNRISQLGVLCSGRHYTVGYGGSTASLNAQQFTPLTLILSF